MKLDATSVAIAGVIFILGAGIDLAAPAIHAFRFLLPHRVKVFPSSAAALARAWIVAELSETTKMTNI
jgi:hypothetical protein